MDSGSAPPRPGVRDRMSDNGTKTELSARQQRALSCLLAGGAAEQAAREAKCSRSTVYRWMGERAFSQALRRTSDKALRELSEQLMELGAAATEALKDGLDGAQDIGVRLRAAGLVVGRVLAVLELADLGERVAVLEQKLEEQHGWRAGETNRGAGGLALRV